MVSRARLGKDDPLPSPGVGSGTGIGSEGLTPDGNAMEEDSPPRALLVRGADSCRAEAEGVSSVRSICRKWCASEDVIGTSGDEKMGRSEEEVDDDDLLAMAEGEEARLSQLSSSSESTRSTIWWLAIVV